MATETIRIQVRPDANTVIVTGSTLSAIENVGSGEGIYKGLSGTIAQLKSINAKFREMREVEQPQPEVKKS